MRYFYIADCHFGHSSVLNFDHRPFADTQQMEEAMVMLWNAAVLKDDMVYILGDFCFGKADEWLRLLRKLKGRKVLIAGNHDLKQYPDEVRNQFEGIAPYLEVADYSRENVARKVILSHYPIPFYKHSNNARYFMLCGHVHITAENDWLEKWTRELRAAQQNGAETDGANRGQIYNVGCMMPWMEYTPRTLDEITRRWEQHATL